MDTVISPEEFKKRLDAGKVEFIFDLRNADEFASWRIEGRNELESLNIPQVAFVGEEEKYLDRFPRDRQIMTICAHGDSSRYTADFLKQHGYDAISLEGGMDAWSEYYETHNIGGIPSIYQIYRVARGCISHFIVSENEAVVIDAVRHTERILDLASSLNARITHVFDTHLQADHISGGGKIAKKTGAVYHISAADAGPAAYAYAGLKDGETVMFGKSRIAVIHTPGHTPGSVSLLLDNKFLFTGDTIMKKSIGRPDLGGRADEWSVLLYNTLFEKFNIFGDDLIVLPTHASSLRDQSEDGIVRTTMGEARSESDLYKLKTFPEFLESVRASLPENPERYQDIRRVNLGLLNPDEKKSRELEIGKNLCGMAKR